MGTSLLSHQLLSCSLFLISQEAPEGRCLDCHCSISLSFESSILTCFLFPLCLSVLVSMKAHTHIHTQTYSHIRSFSFSLSSSIAIEFGLICTPGQLIGFPVLSCEQLPFLRDSNLFIECSASGSIILNVLPE